MPSPSLSIACLLFCAFTFGADPALANPITWNLQGVEFTDGTQATGSFEYDADTNTVSNIDIVTALATYTSTAPAFPIKPFEFVFVPSVPLVTGANVPALVLFPASSLTDAGGTVSVSSEVNGFSLEGVICDSACDGVTTAHQIDAGALTSTAVVPVPEPEFAPIWGAVSLCLLLWKRSA